MIFFCDNPPLKEKGFGLSVLTYNQLLGLGGTVKHVLTFRGQNGVIKADIVADATWPTFLCDDALGGWAERKLKGKIRYGVEATAFLISLPRILAILRCHPESPVFAPIGASASLLWRVLLLRILAKNALWLYFVDDIELINKRMNRRFENLCARLMLPASLRKADRIFVISEGLGNVYAKRHGVKAGLILPCFKTVAHPPRKSPPGERNVTFVFSGGLSFLYNDTLLAFQKSLLALNNAHPGSRFRLIIQTYSPKSQFTTLGFDESVTEYRTAEKRGDFASYREADCFLVPYSFDPEMKIMVTTSFPQKVAELLQMSRPILFFGPAYSSVVGFFKKADVPLVVDTPDPNVLEETILSLVEPFPAEGLLERYAALHRDHFSPAAAATSMLSGRDPIDSSREVRPSPSAVGGANG